MKAVILAAGESKRLRPLTEKTPKCLIEVGGISILERQINSYLKNGIEEVVVVTGYLSDMIDDVCNNYDKNVKTLKNDVYDKTNNMYSFLLTETIIKSDFFLSNADVVFDNKIIDDMIQRKGEDLIAVDRGNYYEESMKIIVKDGKIQRISKKISAQDAYGTSIDVYLFSEKLRKVLFDKARDIIINQFRKNEWMEVVIDEVIKKFSVYPFDIKKSKWVEIDTYEDLETARELYS